MNVLSLSYGKDSIACIHVAIDILGWKVDRIVHAEVMFDDETPADLPPMVEFKKYADSVIKDRWGIEVEHVRAKDTFKSWFMKPVQSKMKNSKHDWVGRPHGWPLTKGSWCLRQLKLAALDAARGKNNIVYVGIAVDEPERYNELSEFKKYPLVQAGWTEDMCMGWCRDNGLLSPVYEDSYRGGCWFCPKQPLKQLRILRKKYPYLWQMVLDIDPISPVTFKPNKHTLMDYERRFAAEDDGIVPCDNRFKWAMIDGAKQGTRPRTKRRKVENRECTEFI